MIDAFLINLNEEELLQYCLESFESFVDLLQIVSIVDNGSSDDSLDIVESFKTRLPIVLQREVSHSHHGHLRNLAISKCKSPWIFYLDGDETCTSDMAAWLRGDEKEQADGWDFYKYTTIVDCFHTVRGGNGPCYRLFRNREGVGYSQNVHTEAYYPGMGGRRQAVGPQLFDHTACKSVEALIAKGQRYQVHQGTVGVGPWHEYLGRVNGAHEQGTIELIPEDVRRRIFTGPGFVK